MNDPSNGVPPALLHHVHLLSNFRFPTVAHMSVETIVDYLLQAVNITRHTAPMNWTYLDAPADGTVLLVWQPGQLGTHFASDGYVWADPEQAFSLDAKGCTVEMYVHRSGYHPPNESVATHCRRRYRLTASKSPSPTASIDPSLWLVHYAACDENARIPANRIPVSPHTQQIMNARRFLQTQGQLVRKEFMLHDRNNWPTISLPGGQMPAGYPQHGPMYPHPQPPHAGRGHPPPGPYYAPPQGHPQAGMGPSPAKRARQNPPAHPAGAAPMPGGPPAPPVDPFLEDEEDTARGDLLDHLTPREIATVRYKQHHEWMEEIVSSPYAIHQIMPVDLALGLKGELEPLTKGIFDPPTGPRATRPDDAAWTGRWEAGKTAEFAKRVEKYIASRNADLEKREKIHDQRMKKLAQKGKALRLWEDRLRLAEHDPTETGPEVWRLEGQADTNGAMADGDDGGATTTSREKVDDIIKEVEAGLGKRIIPKPEASCVRKGGLQDNLTEDGGPPLEFIAPPAPAEDAANRDIDMDGTAGALMDDFGLPLVPTPEATVSKPEPTPPSAPESTVTGAPSAPAGLQAAQGGPMAKEPGTTLANPDGDVEMDGVQQEAPSTTAVPTLDGGEWIIVSKENTPTVEQSTDATGDNAKDENAPLEKQPAMTTAAPAVEATTVTAADTALSLDDVHAGETLETSAADDVLAAFDDDDLGLGDTSTFGLEDSAFGDAFLGTEGMNGDGVGGEGE
ncbi:MAG: hypothetical protein M1838_001373 [Thelocarpon superellum]|nr:MAG: hypothetical protein M1838_001373 [Thelocarpon superellum]